MSESQSPSPSRSDQLIKAAIYREDAEEVSKLIFNGARMNGPWPKLGRGRGAHTTALHEAAKCSNAEILRILLDNGGDIKVADSNGLTVLHISVEFLNKDAACLILDRGVDINAQSGQLLWPGVDELRITALHLAVLRGNGFPQLLLERNAAVDVADGKHRTPMDLALSIDDFKTVQILLRYGARFNIESKFAIQARRRASKRGQVRLLCLLFDPNTDRTDFLSLTESQLDEILLERHTQYGPLINSLRESSERKFLINDNSAKVTLCHVCTDLLAVSQHDGYVGLGNGLSSPERFVSQDHFRRSGCPLCLLILHFVEEKKIEIPENQNVRLMTKIEVGDHISLSFDGYEGIGIRLPVVISCFRGPLRSLLCQREAQNDRTTGCGTSLGMASLWLQDCLTNHTSCAITSDDGPSLPTRVIDVWNPKKPFLFISNGEKRPYCTLSYCWGNTKQLRTIQSNIQQHVQGIPHSQLPRTISDAIFVARELQIRYIWVDALCIVQDDAADWAAESTKMASIYRESILTLVAADGIDADAGLFGNHPNNQGFPIPAPLTLPRREDVRLRGVNAATDMPDRPFTTPDDLFMNAFEPSASKSWPINSRAWTLQEQLLSPRLLFFSETLYWHCMEHNSTDIHPEGSLKKPFSCTPEARCIMTGALKRGAFHENLDWNYDFRGLEDWDDIVSGYTRRKLTKRSDRLIAIAGIAERMQSAFKAPFVAGLWGGPFLLRQLLWRPGDQAVVREDMRARMPTWSWASINESVRYPLEVKDQRLTTQAEVVSVDVEKELSRYPFYGKIMLKGKLREMARMPGQSIAKEKGDHETTVPGVTSIFSYYRDYESSDNAQMGVWCLPLLSCPFVRMRRRRTRTYVDDAQSKLAEVFGLCLKPTGLETNEYYRVGCFELYEDVDESLERWDPMEH